MTVDVQPSLGPFDYSSKEQWFQVRGGRVWPNDPEPVVVAPADGPITVDGNLEEWSGVQPLPVAGVDLSSFRLCWDERGLYGAVDIVDDSILALPKEHWHGDCVQVFLERDCARSFDLTDSTLELSILPRPEEGPGDCLVLGFTHGKGAGTEETRVDVGGVAPAAWAPTENGFAIEFLLPASLLAPTKMEVGTPLGLGLHLYDDGVLKEVFVAHVDPDTWLRPYCWGLVRLGE